MDRFCSRREQLRSRLKADEVDALLVSSPTNVSYLTGFSGDSSVLLLGSAADTMISDGRFTSQLEQECPDIGAQIRLPGQELVSAIAGVVKSSRLRRLAF